MKSREEKVVELAEHLSRYHYSMGPLLTLPLDVLEEIHKTAKEQGGHPA